jgi:hypothetical protein
MKEFVDSLQDTQQKINRCPPDEVKSTIYMYSEMTILIHHLK